MNRLVSESKTGSVTVSVAWYQFSGSSWSQVSGTLASFSGTVGTLVGSARFQNLTSPVTLTPGTYAIVAANYGAAGASAWNAAVSISPPLPTFNNGGGLISMTSPNTAFYGSGSTLSSTLSGLTGGNWGSPTPAFAGATFDFAPVPEVEDYAVIAVGLLGLVYIGCYARNQRTQKLA